MMSARKPQSDQLSAGRNLARPTAAKRYFVGAKVNTSGVRSLLFRGISRQAQGGPAVALKTLAEKFGVYAEGQRKVARMGSYRDYSRRAESRERNAARFKSSTVRMGEQFTRRHKRAIRFLELTSLLEVGI